MNVGEVSEDLNLRAICRAWNEGVLGKGSFECEQCDNDECNEEMGDEEELPDAADEDPGEGKGTSDPEMLNPKFISQILKKIRQHGRKNQK